MQSVSESEQLMWRPSFPEMPRTLRIIPVNGADAMEWTLVAAQCAAEGSCEDFARGIELGMNVIKSELLLPLDREPPVEQLLSCFSAATANRRSAKLSRILHLVHNYPGAALLHKGLRFVTASLWASYASLGLEGEEGKLQSARISSAGQPVWAAHGWKVGHE